MKFINIKLLLLSLVTVYSSTAMALPSLQLGSDPANPDAWDYVAGGDDTWYTSADSFNLFAYANVYSGGHGKYAWDPLGSSFQFAYLVAAATPNTTDGADVFDISIAGNGPVNMVSSGFGAPPINDPNALADHGIFDTYFEVYEFRFDGPVVNIGNTQPLEFIEDPEDISDGPGYAENFEITINSLTDIEGVHFDLFTVKGERWYPLDPIAEVNAFAPYSHDAEYKKVPEPAMPGLLAIGMLGLVIARRKKAKA